MKLVINKISVDNFKGLTCSFGFSDRKTKIYGDNATGKTTLYDAFLWLLFDKDSKGNAKFEPKNISKSDAMASVAINITVDGISYEIAKTLKEKWTKKRGQSQKEFTGNEITFSVDGVPKKKSEFKTFISEMIEEESFKLTTNPFYFSELHWTKRRELLMSIVGEVSDLDVCDTDDLKKFVSELQGRSLVDHKKVIAARKAKINKELIVIPERIDELLKTLCEVEHNPIKLADLQAEKVKILNLLSSPDSRKIDIENQILELKRLDYETDFEYSKLATEYHNKNNDKTRRDMELNQTIGKAVLELNAIEVSINETRASFISLRDRPIVIDDCCSECRQLLPDEIKSRYYEERGLKKSDQLIAISEEGKALVKQEKKLQAELDQAREELKGLQSIVIEKPKQGPNHFDQINQLTAQLSSVEKTAPTNQQERLEVVNNLINLELSNKGKIEQFHKSQARIEELKAERKNLSDEFEELERQLFLIEQINFNKSQYVEEKIKKSFALAEFKMYNLLINGGQEEVCEIMFEGVPFSTNLNNAARINVGLDIINTISKKMDISTPVFIDNAESVTELIKTESQMICLYVSADHKQLTIAE